MPARPRVQAAALGLALGAAALLRADVELDLTRPGDDAPRTMAATLSDCRRRVAEAVAHACARVARGALNRAKRKRLEAHRKVGKIGRVPKAGLPYLPESLYPDREDVRAPEPLHPLLWPEQQGRTFPRLEAGETGRRVLARARQRLDLVELSRFVDDYAMAGGLDGAGPVMIAYRELSESAAGPRVVLIGVRAEGSDRTLMTFEFAVDAAGALACITERRP